MAAVSRHESETVESTFSASSSTIPMDSLQDMSDAALVDLREQARLVGWSVGISCVVLY